jgi:membrane protease subunit HflK
MHPEPVRSAADTAPGARPRPARLDEPGRGKPGERPRSAEAPPDLDELWRDFNRRLNALFKRGGGGFKPPRRSGMAPQRALRLVVWLGLVGLVCGWLGSGFYNVDDGEQAVVSRLGRLDRVEAPGLHWHLPVPLEAVELLDVGAAHSVDIGAGDEAGAIGMAQPQMATRDGELVDVHAAVQYHIADPVAYLYGRRNPDDLVAQAAAVALRDLVAQQTAAELLAPGHAGLGKLAQPRLQQLLTEARCGVDVDAVVLVSVQAPQAVLAQQADIAQAMRDAATEKVALQAAAADQLARARAGAAQALQDAQAYQQRVVAQTRADAVRFAQVLPQYRKDPEMTRQTLYLQTMREVLGSVSKLVVDLRDSRSVIELPLGRLVQPTPLPDASAPRAAASAAPAAATASAAPDAAAASAAPDAAAASAAPDALTSAERSRDSLRSRDLR